MEWKLIIETPDKGWSQNDWTETDEEKIIDSLKVF